jgi:hypothetical protein
MLGIIKDFQDLIVGVAGFGGVIWTLSHNAKLAREQHDRTIQHEHELIKRALLAELRRNRHSHQGNLEKFKELEDGAGVMMPLRTITEVYESNFARLAYLSRDELEATLEAYSRIKAVVDRISFAQALYATEESVVRSGYLHVAARLVPLSAGFS